MITAEWKDLPFDEAIDFFRRKVNLPTKRWTDIWEGMHSRAFVVAGGMKADLLSDLRSAADRAISEGTTITEFRKAFDETVRKHGWSYKGSRGWRTGVIFDTNLRTVYAAGHYEQMTDPDVLAARPYWRYIGGLSANPRPLHLEWNGTVLPADDPWWNTHYPPNGWGCKCEVVSVSGREMERDGLKVSKRPDDGTYEWTNPDSGEDIDVPRGIDPGWAYNPGRTAGLNQAVKRSADRMNGGKWVEVDPWKHTAYKRPDIVPADRPIAAVGRTAKTEADIREALRDVIGGNEAYFSNPFGEEVVVNQGIVDHMLATQKRFDGREAYFPFIRETIEDPFEIWLNFARNEATGEYAVRQKYVKVVSLDKKRVLTLVANVDGGKWTGFTFFRGDIKYVNNLRQGRLLWGR